MKNVRSTILKVLLVLFGILAMGSDAECDWEDGEFEIDLPDIWHDHVDYHEDYYYDCCCCW